MAWKAYLPERRTVKGVDPKIYKLMTKAGYDFTTRTELKSSSEPVRITGKGKAKVANTCHITVEESKDSEDGEKDRCQRSSVFDRITFSAIRPSVFQRVSTSIAEDKNQVSTCSSTRLSTFQRLNTTAKKVQSISPTPTTRKSTLKRLSVSVTRDQKKASTSVPSKSSLVTGDEEIHSAVPSRMKRKMFVSVNTEGCCHVTIEETSDHDIFEEGAEVAPLSLEDGGQSTIDELKEVNLGTKEEPRPTFISTQLSDDDENEYVNLLKAYKDVFAWSYKKMPGLNPKVAVHRLTIKLEHRPIKQAQRRFRLKLISQIEEEVNKLIEAGFIREVKYPTWIANIVPVRKKNSQLRATYQSAMQRIFDDMLHKRVECYVDDLIVKSKKKCDHLKDLKLVLDHLRKYQLRINPLKCAFGKMPSPKNLHELRRLQGRLAYIRRFISNLVGRCQPFQRLMRKDAVFDWDQSCQNAFDSIKKYLFNPPVLSAPAVGKPLILYIAAQETSLGALLAQENDKVKDQALADFLADHLVPSNWKLCDNLPDEEVLFVESMEPWIMFFDGATRRSGAGVGIVFISPEKHMLPYSFTLGELCSNNVAEALIIGMQMASEFGINYARRLMDIFDSIVLEHIPRSENKKADALANLATALTVSEDVPINISLCQKWIVPSIESQYEEANAISVYAIDEEDWRQPIIDYLEHGKLPTDPRHRAEIRICGFHQSGPKLQYQLKRMGHYWPTMIHDSMHFAKYCEACQFHANFIHQHQSRFIPTIVSWPFEAWGLDLVGPITPKSSAGHSYILAGTDYFSKWIEAMLLREVKKENIVNFVQTHHLQIWYSSSYRN
ncbi:uncharacterized protein E5676_scaffold318G001470 [Cucumis melo var. makuwa]|uniref:Uncharacterized protein n=1 Tax=Cucumis melo var. makuwa TaxID=1194695 RepID=A0A5A7UYS5_CUCMM|nr:uncharacterized protein E6C27_scaffold22G002090 [Cucumis melo var. makuwa]TYK22138.1 uncharacterized protein E5676_scaffold318G001470 [Cucumis melo var. makuwa]